MFVSAEELRRAAEEAAGGSGGGGMTAMQVARKLAQQTSLAAVKRNGPPAVPMPHDHDLGDIMEEFTRALSDRSNTSELSFAGQVCTHTQTHPHTHKHFFTPLVHSHTSSAVTTRVRNLSSCLPSPWGVSRVGLRRVAPTGC